MSGPSSRTRSASVWIPSTVTHGETSGLPALIDAAIAEESRDRYVDAVVVTPLAAGGGITVGVVVTVTYRLA